MLIVPSAFFCHPSKTGATFWPDVYRICASAAAVVNSIAKAATDAHTSCPPNY